MVVDSDYTISKAFDVARPLGGLRPATFLIDSDGTVRGVYPQRRAKGHAALVLEGCRNNSG
jgi:peroxiredoxin